jgi:hypothetical protein
LIQTEKETVSWVHRDFDIGDWIVLNESVTNGVIELKEFQGGKIVYSQNKVEASVWFHVGTNFNEPINRALDIDGKFGKSGFFDGVVLKIKSNNFAVKHDYQKHGQITIDETKALAIPFFTYDEENRLPTRSWRNVGGGEMVQNYVYKLERIVDVVDDAFHDWVNVNCKFRKIRKAEREDDFFPEGCTHTLTDESLVLYDKKRKELEMTFMKVTGVYKEFLGGLIFS